MHALLVPGSCRSRAADCCCCCSARSQIRPASSSPYKLGSKPTIWWGKVKEGPTGACHAMWFFLVRGARQRPHSALGFAIIPSFARPASSPPFAAEPR